MYEFTQETLYHRAFFTFQKGKQQINVAFEPIQGDSYMVIIFCEDGSNIDDPHDPRFAQTLNKILVDFDSGRNLKYFVAAI